MAVCRLILVNRKILKIKTNFYSRFLNSSLSHMTVNAAHVTYDDHIKKRKKIVCRLCSQRPMRQDPNDCVRVEDHHKSVLIKTWALKICIRNLLPEYLSAGGENSFKDFVSKILSFQSLSLIHSLSSDECFVANQFYTLTFAVAQWEWQLCRVQSLHIDRLGLLYFNDELYFSNLINNQFSMLTFSGLLGPKFPIKMTWENWPNRMLWAITENMIKPLRSIFRNWIKCCLSL